MRTVLGFVLLGLSVVELVLFFVYGSEIWAMENQLHRIGIVLLWPALFLSGGFLLKARSERLKDWGFLKSAKGKPRIWPKVPVTVYSARDLSELWLAAIDYAIDHINSKVGFRLLWPRQVLLANNSPDTPGFHTIKVRDDNGDDPKHGSTMFYPEEPPTQSALVTVPEQEQIPLDERLNDDEMRNLVLHELGHALGLDHDETPDSIMWPNLQERPGTLTSRDVERLRATYRPRMG